MHNFNDFRSMVDRQIKKKKKICIHFNNEISLGKPEIKSNNLSCFVCALKIEVKRKYRIIIIIIIIWPY